MITSEIIWHPNGGRLVVAMPERGILIRCEDATDTFVKVIKRIGIERVVGLDDIEIRGIPLVSTVHYPDRRQRRVSQHYITMGLNPRNMGRRLKQIADRLGISLYTELFPSTEETSRAVNTLEDPVEIGRKVAELRINPEGAEGMAWRKIREQLGLTRNQFHKGIRSKHHFKESVVERIESFKGGWECHVNLERLCGFKPTGEWIDRIERCKPRRNL